MWSFFIRLININLFNYLLNYIPMLFYEWIMNLNVPSKQNNNLSWNIQKLHGNTRFNMFSIFIKIEKSVISFRKLSQTIYQRFQRRRSPIHVTDKDPIVHPLRRVMENSIWRRWGLPMKKSHPVLEINFHRLLFWLLKPDLFTN